MQKVYNFNCAEAFAKITLDWRRWANDTGAKKFILGLSGGKDSSVVAALAVKIFGAENVYGVFMPNTDYKDENIVNELCKHLGLEKGKNYFKACIHDAYVAITSAMTIINEVDISSDTAINLPARLRMAMIYAYGQSLGARPLCTSNLSENVVGYSTLYGDHAGSYAPIGDLTVTEVIQLGEWLGLDKKFTRKTPEDGLSGKTDEENLGITYAELDQYIRTGVISSEEKRKKIINKFEANTFKTLMVDIPTPQMCLPMHVKSTDFVF
ncbi:MAG: NAD(+) synthase [Bacilli bacterium]